jgi:beta-lactamase class A
MPTRTTVVSLLAVQFLLPAGPAARAAEPASDPRLGRLERQIRAFARTIPGEVGVAVRHVETGRQVLLRGNEKFPMASTFKVPVVVEVYAQVRAGKLSLDDEVALEPKDRHLGSGSLRHYRLPGVKLSVRNLVELMMTVSDNSATDWLVEKVGVENVNARLKEAGVEGIVVNRTCQELILDYLGLGRKEFGQKPLEEVIRAADRLSPRDAAVAAARRRYYTDGQDSSTPAGMADLLTKIVKAEMLDRAACDEILAVMRRCQTGENRLPDLLPPGTALAHKTGTVGTTVNDVGVITLPDGAGHVVVCVFTKDARDDAAMYDKAKAEKVIAQIGRAAYDYFLFTAPLAEEAGK